MVEGPPVGLAERASRSRICLGQERADCIPGTPLSFWERAGRGSQYLLQPGPSADALCASASPGGRGSGGIMRKAGAIVIGGDYRALGVVRSLGRRGIPVWVLTNEHRVATASRYVRFDGDWPWQPAQQIRYLLKLCDLHRLDGWALFPTDDEASAVLAQHHAVLSKRFLMTTPPWDVLRWSYDKRLTHRLASETGVAQPRTFMPKNRHEAVPPE